MTPAQNVEVVKFIDYLHSKTLSARTASERERARKLWDALIAMRSELQAHELRLKGVDS